MPECSTSQPLLCHPATPAPIVSGIDVSVARLIGERIAFRYCLRGDMARLRVPSGTSVERTSLLWEHTCFEAFVAFEESENYREFNFSPSGQWAAFDFAAYRQRRVEDPVIDTPLITTRLTEGRLELEAVIRTNDLSANPSGRAWRIGMAAVVESADTVDGSHSYWALYHASPRPDFHHSAGFLTRFAPDAAVAQTGSN